MSTLIQLVDAELRHLILHVENKLGEMMQEASNALMRIGEPKTPVEVEERDYLQLLVNETAKSIVRMNEFANLEVAPDVSDEEFLKENETLLEDYRQRLKVDLERATELVSRQRAITEELYH